MALNAQAAFKMSSSGSPLTVPQFESISSQNTVSSASSTAGPILAIHSARERPCPPLDNLPQLRSRNAPTVYQQPANRSDRPSFTIRTAKAFVRSRNS
jgi:hypothetical protein